MHADHPCTFRTAGHPAATNANTLAARRRGFGWHAVVLLAGLCAAQPVLARSPSLVGLTPAATVLPEPPPPAPAPDPGLLTPVMRAAANECLVAGFTAMIMALSLGGTAPPAAAAALGSVQGISLAGIGALGCSAGGLAAAVSANLTNAWDEPAMLTAVAKRSAATAWNAMPSASDSVILGWLSAGGARVHAAIGMVGGAVGSAIGDAATTLVAMITGPSVQPSPAPLTASVPAKADPQGVIAVDYQPAPQPPTVLRRRFVAAIP
jgi:hypothetical protein